MDHLCDTYNGGAQPVRVCPERDIECGANANTWCHQCPQHKSMGFAAAQAIDNRKTFVTGELHSENETHSQRMERIHRGDPGWPWPKASDVVVKSLMIRGAVVDGFGLAASINGPVAIEPMIVAGQPVAYSVVDGQGDGYITGSPTLMAPGVTICGQRFDVSNIHQLVAQVAAYHSIKELVAHPEQDGVLARIREAIAKAEAA